MRINLGSTRPAKGIGLVRVLAGAGVLLAVACSPRLPTPPELASTPDERREQDLDYLVAVIEQVHPDPFLRQPEATFRAEVEAVRSAIPELDDASFHVALLRLLSSLQDAHCGMWMCSSCPHAMRCLPASFDEGVFAIACNPDHMDLLGARIVSINGHSSEHVLDRCGEVIPASNTHRTRHRAPDLIMRPSLLRGLGLAEHADRITVEFELPGGDLVTREFRTEGFDGDSWYHVLRNMEDLPATIHPQLHESGAPYWWMYLPDDRMVYLQYNAVQTHDEYPFDEMVEEFLARIDRDDVARVVVDVRYNGGGNNGLIDPLDDGLASLARRGRLDHLYVLTGPATFSSGVDVVVRLRGNAGAIVVGTPTGGMPNSFGNAVDFTLPDSGIEGWCSSGYFRLIDGDPGTLVPDVDVGRPWSDYSSGRDTALEWILSQDDDARGE